MHSLRKDLARRRVLDRDAVDRLPRQQQQPAVRCSAHTDISARPGRSSPPTHSGCAALALALSMSCVSLFQTREACWLVGVVVGAVGVVVLAEDAEIKRTPPKCGIVSPTSAADPATIFEN